MCKNMKSYNCKFLVTNFELKQVILISDKICKNNKKFNFQNKLIYILEKNKIIILVHNICVMA